MVLLGMGSGSILSERRQRGLLTSGSPARDRPTAGRATDADAGSRREHTRLHRPHRARHRPRGSATSAGALPAPGSGLLPILNSRRKFFHILGFRLAGRVEAPGHRNLIFRFEQMLWSRPRSPMSATEICAVLQVCERSLPARPQAARAPNTWR